MKRDPEETKNLSRRDFVKTTAAGVSATVLTGLGAQEAEAQARPPDWDKQADVVGGGAVARGGGTSRQKKYGIEDSPDILFRDLTDWSVVEPNGFPDYRYNDKE